MTIKTPSGAAVLNPAALPTHDRGGGARGAFGIKNQLLGFLMPALVCFSKRHSRKPQKRGERFQRLSGYN